jgi:hypothetical protein
MTGMAPDTALRMLHDYYQPAPPAWTPQTVGWYGLFVTVLLSFLWLGIRSTLSWFKNRYRREAVRGVAVAAPAQFSILLKRAALAAWPREEIASLSGEAWLDFLNRTGTSEPFRTSPGNQIEEIALNESPASEEDELALRRLAMKWIRRHRVQT